MTEISGMMPLSVRLLTTVPASSHTSHINSMPSKNSSMLPLLPTPNMKPLVPVRKINPVEMQIRCEKGLSYTCDEKFTSTHKYANCQFMWLQIDEE